MPDPGSASDADPAVPPESPDEGPGRYRHAFVEGDSYRRCVELVTRSGVTAGVVLDLGCGFGAVAEPLADLGLTYVGTDLAPEGLADLEVRGFEAHRLDLRADSDDLVAGLDALVGDRPLAFVLALDVLEHLSAPARTAAALAQVCARRGGGLVVSYPNITHLDIAAKLLVGRWDRSDEGLLDRTHLQFFDQRGLVDMLAGTGWRQSDEADVRNEHSDQSYPAEAPALRPGAPLRDLLRAVRHRAEPSGATYQFVRRFELDPSGAVDGTADAELDPAPARFAAVVLAPRPDTDPAPLLADLAEQTFIDFELITVDPGPDQAGRLAGAVAGAAATARYVCVVRGSERLGSAWLSALVDAAAAAPGQVLRVGVGDPGGPDGGEPLAPESFSLLSADPPGSVVAAAYAVPGAVIHSAGVLPEPAAGEAAVTAYLARAVLLAGLHVVGDRVVRSATGTEPALDSDPALDALAGEPIVLPAGSAARLVELRTRLATHQTEQQRLQIELLGALEHARGISARRDEKFDLLAAQLGRLEGDRNRLANEVDRLRAESRWSQLSARVRRRPPP